MLKKSLIFVSAALFLVALITLTGCPTSVDDDGSSGTVYAHRIYGRNVDPYTAQEAIDRAVAAGEPIVLEDNLTIGEVGNPGGHLNFKNAQVRINGDVTFPNGVVSVVDASVSWAKDATFLLPGGRYIHRKYDNVTPVNTDALVEYAESPGTIMDTARWAAVKRFKPGPKQNYDYSTDSNGVDVKFPAQFLQELYVLDELTIDDSQALPPSADLAIIAMGTVDVTASPIGVVVGGNLQLGTCSTLTTSKGGSVVTVPAAPTVIPNIKVEKNFAIQQAVAGALTIAGKLTGAGTLEVLGAVGNITIAGGDGNIRFSGAAAPGLLTIDSSGTVTFDNSVPATGGRIAGNAVFGGNLVTNAALTLGGDVILPAAGVVTLSANALTLGAGKTISVRFTPRGLDPVIAPVLTAGPEDVVLTPAGAATLTVPGNPTQTNETAIGNAKRLTLTAAALTVTDGTLRVASGASFVIDNQILTTNTVGNVQIGYLAVEDGGSLLLANGGSIDIGNTTISAASTIRAGGGTITLGNNTIEGSVYGAALTATAGAPAFNLGAQLLTLKQANLNLATNGSLVISAGARVELTGRGKITLNNTEGGVPTTRSRINNNSVLSGEFEGLTSPSATTTQAVWSVAHRDASAANVSITATGAVTLAKSATTFTTN
jgi:hypothetical protein